MPSRARRKPHRLASVAVKIDHEVVALGERLAAGARISFDAYLTQALRHYNRFHALTKHNRVRTLRTAKVVALFPVEETAPPSAPVRRAKRRRQSR